MAESSSKFSLCPFTSNTSKTVTNAHLVEFPIEINELNKWSIPDVPYKNIYKFEIFNLKSLATIKTMERTMNIDQENQTIRLLNEEDISISILD